MKQRNQNSRNGGGGPGANPKFGIILENFEKLWQMGEILMELENLYGPERLSDISLDGRLRIFDRKWYH